MYISSVNITELFTFMADILKDELKNYLIESGHEPIEQELANSIDSLVSFFELLIEVDKKLEIVDETPNN